ncbi:glycosyltransferase family A protein [Rhodanobacter umsongensis]
MTHSFVVPAYGHSRYLEACLQSLATQSTRSDIIIVTSTPCDEVTRLAEKYRARLHTHSPNRGIAHDWNMAVAQATTDWVTLAHQDDVYHPDFTARTMAAIASHPGAILAFTNYEEMLDEKLRPPSKLLFVKKALLELGFLGRSYIGRRFSKFNCLRFGCAIPCPTATINKACAPFQFDGSFRVNLDWAAWLYMCDISGGFVWIRGAPLMAHRIHESSETSAGIVAGHRVAEDRILLRRMWPAAIADLIVKSYKLAYASNQPQD